jgi:zinc transporter 1/2/3
VLTLSPNSLHFYLIPDETNVTAVEDPCIASASSAAYTTSTRVGGVFILLGTSLAGVLSTLLLGQRRGEYFKVALQYAKFFGIGVMISTAWIHLLPDSFERFGSPCLTGAWLTFSKGWVGAFAMLSTFFVQMIDFLLSAKGVSGHSHGSNIELSTRNPSSPSAALDTAATRTSENLECDCNASPTGDNMNSSISAIIVDPSDPTLAACAVHGPPEVSTALSHAMPIRDPELSILILEAGILVHSFIIGLTMGVSDDTIFDVLLIAISFHQV